LHSTRIVDKKVGQLPVIEPPLTFIVAEHSS